jgi:CSLREA domain-containing protein
MYLALLVLVGLPSVGFPQPGGPQSPPTLAQPAVEPLAPPGIGFLFTVNSTGDGDNVTLGAGCDADSNTPGEQCTLRAAIEEANALSSDDTIEFAISTTDPGFDPGSGMSTINLTKALPDLSAPVVIMGPGANLLTVRRTTGGNYGMFIVTTTGAVTLSGMTISNGAAVSGGGILNVNGATVNVSGCALTLNSAGRGGGVANDGTGRVNIDTSTLDGNSATDRGGGIANRTTGIVSVANSTLANNAAMPSGLGGAIGNFGSGAVTVTNSTISGNSASAGGGIFNFFDFFGGQTSTVRVRSSLIAGNTAIDVSGDFSSQGFNWIGNAGNAPPTNFFDHGTGFDAATDEVGTADAPLDPRLDPNGLHDNGGPTKTIALRCGSRAIDKGTSAGLTGVLTTDGRGVGFARTFDDAAPNVAGGDGTDIGAFEVQQSCTALPGKNGCAAAKLKLASQSIKRQFGCNAHAITKNAPLDTACLTKARQKLVTAFARVDAKGGCVNPGDADGVAADVNRYALSVTHEEPWSYGQTHRHFQPLISRSWTLPAGSERYECRRILVPADTLITGFRALAPTGTYEMILTVADSATQTGDYDCNAGNLDNHMLYASGIGTGDVLFPKGTVVRIDGGQYLNLNLHVVNSGATALSGISGILARTTSKSALTSKAEMIFAGTFTIDVPADGMPHTAVGGCTAPRDYQILALWPHMQALGTHIQVQVTHAATAETILDLPYAIDTQRTYWRLPAITMVRQGDQIKVTCTYLNDTAQPVQFGDSSAAEQCFVGFYRSPATGGNLFECSSN